ncbi:hypothetical protein MMC34_004534 [Xylographa carneopallida]|nr:hypothetical protein [Xylographa carneopallida]
MRAHASLAKDSDANAAAAEAFRGAAVGAAKTGIPLALLALVGLAISPLYRGLTVQFRLFVQMSGMTLGGMVEADRRLREYEALVRRRRRVERDEAVWRRYETLLEEEEAEAGAVAKRGRDSAARRGGDGGNK